MRPDVFLYAPLTKVEKSESVAADELPEYVIVEGVCTGPDVDLDGQRMDPDWLKEALPEWFRDWGNIREMHQPVAVGVANNLVPLDNGDYNLRSKIIDRDAVRKVAEGVYKGYSIGIKQPKYQVDPVAPKGRVVGGKVIEVSLVDRPAYDSAKFYLVKSLGPGEFRDMQSGLVVKTSNTEAIEVDLSFEQLKDKINQMVGYSSWVMETYADHVIVSENDRYYKYPLTIGEDGTITLGAREEVQRTYQPVQVANAQKAAGKEDAKCEKCGKTVAPGENHECVAKAADGGNDDGEADKTAARFKEIKAQIGTLLGELEIPKPDEKAVKAATDGVPVKEKLDFYNLSVIKEVVNLVQALAAQVDGALKALDPKAAGNAGSIPATTHGAPGNPTDINKSSVDDLQTLVVAEVTKALSSPDTAGKVLTADALKAAIGDLVKAAVDAVTGEIVQRLEQVEQSAAPAKGGLMEIDKRFAGNPDNVVSDVRKAVSVLTETAQDQSEEGQLKRAEAMYALSSLARKGA